MSTVDDGIATIPSPISPHENGGPDGFDGLDGMPRSSSGMRDFRRGDKWLRHHFKDDHVRAPEASPDAAGEKPSGVAGAGESPATAAADPGPRYEDVDWRVSDPRPF
jgi:hypothetical protein